MDINHSHLFLLQTNFSTIAVAAKMESAMSSMQISEAFAPKVPAGSRGTAAPIKTNVNEMKLKPNVPIYKYDFRLSVKFKKADGSESVKELSKQTRDDFPEQERKSVSVRIYKKMLVDPVYKKFFGDSFTIYFDRAAALFTLQKLALQGEVHTINLPPTYISDYPDCNGFEVKVKEVADSFQASTNDVNKCVNIRQANEDKTLIEALNIIVSQPALLDTQKFISYGNGVHYLYQPDPKVFRETDFPALPDGKYMGVGAHKSVKILEGKGNPTPYITTEIKKTAFHSDGQPLIEKLMQMSLFVDFRGNSRFTVEEANRAQKKIKEQLKNLYVEAGHTKRKQRFPILGIGHSARETKLNVDGKIVTLETYFAQKYNIKLKYPTLFTVISRSPGRKDDQHYPVELLTVCPNQRVISSQQTPDQNAITIKACASLPKDRQRQTDAMRKELGIVNSNEYFKKMGITVEENSVVANGRVLPAPGLQYGGKKMIVPQDNCKWNGDRFLEAATLKNWVVIGQFLQKDSSFPLEQYTQKLVEMMRRKGMTVSDPKIVRCNQPSEHAVDSYIKQAAQEKVQLLFFVSTDGVKLHDYIKTQEVIHQVLTQEVKVSKALAVIQKNQVQTLENIVMKTNAKLGGLSKLVVVGNDPKTQQWVLDPKRLFVGFEFSHPDPMSKAELDRGGDYRMPTVIGWGANCGSLTQSFVGDFSFVAPRQSKPLSDSLGTIFEQILRQFYKNRKGPPTHLVIYYNGISQGQWHIVAGEYLNILKATCKRINAQYAPAITCVAVSKDHNERFYGNNIQGTRAAEQNIRPGTIIDQTIVSPVVTEFYLNSHSAFQGTAKTPKYSVLVDTTKMPADVIEGMTHGLCYMHEIVNMTVSLPAPLVVADRCAKRGRNNYATQSGSTSASAANLNLEMANAELTYKGKNLADVRYNA